MLLYLATESSEEGPNPVVPPLGEIIIGLIAFAILAYVLMKYVWPRMEATFEARRDAIEGGIKRAEEAQDEAKRLLTEYRQQLAEARTEAAQIRDNARAEGQRIIEEMRTTAQEESARIIARGEEQLDACSGSQVVRELRGRDRHARDLAGREDRGIRRCPTTPRVRAHGRPSSSPSSTAWPTR